MFPDLIGEPTTSNLKSSVEKVEFKRLKVCDKRSIENSYLDCRPVAKAEGHNASRYKDSTSEKPQESSMKRKLEELHTLFFCAEESNVKNTAVDTHLQGVSHNSCGKNAFKIDSARVSQPRSLVNALGNKHEEFLLTASVVPSLAAKYTSSKKLSSYTKKSHGGKGLGKQTNPGKKSLDEEECLLTAEKMECCKLPLERNCVPFPSGQSVLICSATNSYKEDDFEAHYCRTSSPNFIANHRRKKMKKTQSSDFFADLQTPSESFLKENLAPNSSTNYKSTGGSSKTCTILSTEPQDFHHRLKKQFNQLHSSFFSSQDSCAASSVETPSLLSSTKNSCKFTQEKALVCHLEDVPGSLTDSKSVELAKIKSTVAQTSAVPKTSQNSVSLELSSVNSMGQNDLARVRSRNLEKNFSSLASNIQTLRRNEQLTQEPALGTQKYKSSTKLGKKSNSESSLGKYAFSSVKKLSIRQSSQKSDSFESNLKTELADQEKHLTILKTFENEERKSFPTSVSSADMQHCNLCSEPSSSTPKILKNLQCENSHSECLEKETYELSEDQCEVFFSSVTEWRKFMSSPISCGFKSSDLCQDSADCNHSTELALANEESNVISVRNFLSKPEKCENLHRNKNCDFELGSEKNVGSESEKSEDSLYCKNQSDFAITMKNSMSTSGQANSLQQLKTQSNNEIETKSKPLSIGCEIPFLTIKKPEPENQTNVTNSVQLLIMDLLNVTPTSRRSYFMFHNLVIHRVDVFGTITGVRPIGEDKIIYEVDDGSGTISCMHQIAKLEARLRKFEGFLNLSRNDDTFNQTEVTITNQSFAEQSSEQDTAFKEFKACMENHLIKSNEDLFYKIGDTIHATGVLYDFRGTISFYIYDIRKVKNIAEETDRYQEMAILYHSIYPKTIKGFKT